MNADNFFAGCFTEAEIKARYRDLCKVHHPDLGGSDEMMKLVNLAYEARLRGEFRKDYDDETAENMVDLEKEVAAKVAEIIGLKGIVIELVGRWVWVTGNTWPVKDTIKRAGFSWASQKRCWFWHKPEDKCPSRARKTLDEIKAKYGSTVLRGAGRPCLSM